MDFAANIFEGIVGTFLQMSPYLLFGFAVAGILSVFISKEMVERHMGGRGLGPVLKATLLGIPLPLCSCGVIPVAASLRKHGASRGATLSFLMSTPQTGVDSIAVTHGMLGPALAVFRPLVALVSGVIGGWLVDTTDGREGTKPEATPPPCQDECCAPTKKTHWLVRAMDFAFAVLPRDIAKPLLLGVVVAGAIAGLVPDDFFASTVGTGLGAMVVMMLIGIPLYVCATASVPIAAALILKGVSPGAALVFLITGPATNAAALMTLWKILGKKATFIYLGTVALTALAAGLLFDQIALAGIVAPPCHGDASMLPRGVELTSAFVLAGVLAWALLPRRRRPESRSDAAASQPGVVLKVTGMTCSHCVETATRTLQAGAGVRSVHVDLSTATATVFGASLDIPALQRSLESLGFSSRIVGP